MKYTYLILLMFLLSSALSYGQDQAANGNSSMDSKHELTYDDLDTLTKVRLSERYQSSDLLDLKKDAQKLVLYNYYFSKSFKIKESQEYSINEYLKIDVSAYDNVRSEDEPVEVTDNDSGLVLILDSKNLAKQKMFEFDISIPVEPEVSSSKYVDQ